MLFQVRKKVYANRYRRKMIMKSQALALAAQIIIMIIFVVLITAQIQSPMPVV